MDEVRGGKSGQPEQRIHAWHIEQREYARQEGRGGRWHAFERIEPQRTALVVIDVVPSFVEDVVYCRGIVPSISRLASRVRTTGGMVAWRLPGPSGRSVLVLSTRACLLGLVRDAPSSAAVRRPGGPSRASA